MNKRTAEQIPLTPIRAIRYKCLDCCCGSVAEVRECVCTRCALYPYRLGRRQKDPAALVGDWERGQ